MRVFPMPGKSVKFYLKINTDHWSTKKQIVMSADKQSDKYNKYIEAVKAFTTDTIINRRIEKDPIGPGELSQLLKDNFIGQVVKNEYCYKDFISYWVSLQTCTDDTKAAYQSSLRRALKLYPDLDWKDITMKWRIESESKFKEAGYKVNTIHDMYKRMRDCLNDAFDMKVANIEVQKNKNWMAKTEKADNIFLTRGEISQLYNFDYKRIGLRNAVDMFVLGCETGQRYGDFSKINKGMKIYVNDETLLRFPTQKSGGKLIYVSIPTNDRIDEILERVRPISDQKLRDYIKEAAKIAGLEKWERISTHTARRSFATNNVIDGVPNRITMSICGWKTEKQMLEYVKYTDVMTAVDFMKEKKKKIS
jgi:integrase